MVTNDVKRTFYRSTSSNVSTGVHVQRRAHVSTNVQRRAHVNPRPSTPGGAFEGQPNDPTKLDYGNQGRRWRQGDHQEAEDGGPAAATHGRQGDTSGTDSSSANGNASSPDNGNASSPDNGNAYSLDNDITSCPDSCPALTRISAQTEVRKMPIKVGNSTFW